MGKNNKTEEERRKVWREIFASEMIVKKYNGNTYIGYLGMYLKLDPKSGMAFKMNRDSGKWDPVDGITLLPLKIKGEHGLRGYSEGYEPNDT